jgi:hypothetical protein
MASEALGSVFSVYYQPNSSPGGDHVTAPSGVANVNQEISE